MDVSTCNFFVSVKCGKKACRLLRVICMLSELLNAADDFVHFFLAVEMVIQVVFYRAVKLECLQDFPF